MKKAKNISVAVQETENNSGNGGIQVEEGIDIPPFRSRVKYPFALLEPGNSFVIPKPVAKASVTVSYWKKKLQEDGNPNIDFTIRSIDANSSRVWRIDGLDKTNKK